MLLPDSQKDGFFFDRIAGEGVVVPQIGVEGHGNIQFSLGKV